MTLLARDSQQLQQSLLERSEFNLDWTEANGLAGILDRGSQAKLLRVVRNEVTALPVAVEHGRDLGERVGVANAGQPHVPLEAGHLRGMRQV